MKILYVEDTMPNIILIERIASMGHHKVLNYNNAEEALRYFERDDPDLVLVDIRLDGFMSGLDLVRKLRAQGYTTPMIAITAFVTDGAREQCIEAGCNDYIPKPLDVRRILQMIAYHATVYRQQQAATEKTSVGTGEPVHDTSREKTPVCCKGTGPVTNGDQNTLKHSE
ncbi:MAG: response regulator [Anaerolineae bacterium]|nr:response regulator [Anaerolineae bacterium]